MRSERCLAKLVNGRPPAVDSGMATMNVSLDDELKAFATSDRVKARGFSSASEYIRHLVRVDRELDRLRGLIEEGLESGPAEPLTPDTFDRLRRRAREG